MIKNIIIPIGNHCWVADSLKLLKLRKKAYPFDWVQCQPTTLFLIFFKILTLTDKDMQEFVNDFFNFEKNQILTSHYNVKNYFKNLEYDIEFPHDYINDIKEKYLRRFTRLRDDFFNSDNILFIFAGRDEKFDNHLKSFLEKVGTFKDTNKIHLLCINGFEENFDNNLITNIRVPFIRDEHWLYDSNVYKFYVYNCFKNYFNDTTDNKDWLWLCYNEFAINLSTIHKKRYDISYMYTPEIFNYDYHKMKNKYTFKDELLIKVSCKEK